jgi:hypothetical protein
MFSSAPTPYETSNGIFVAAVDTVLAIAALKLRIATLLIAAV